MRRSTTIKTARFTITITTAMRKARMIKIKVECIALQRTAQRALTKRDRGREKEIPLLLLEIDVIDKVAEC